MKSDSPLSTELVQERESLSYAARLHWFHWCILVLSALLTIAAWYFSKSQIEERARFLFDREATQAVELVSERLLKYEDALWSGVAAIHANGGKMQYEDWQTFAETLRIDAKYPGISGIGVIEYVPKNKLDEFLARQRKARPDFRIHPTHDRPDYLPIVYIEPSGPNAKAVGLDMNYETNRYVAAMKARELAAAQITAPIVLVQDEEHAPGFLLFAPYYTKGSHESVSARQENFLGMVYAPFIVNKLVAGTLDKSKRQVGIRLLDDTNVLYDEHHNGERDFDPNPLLTSQQQVKAYGRTWTFDIRSTKSFRATAQNSQPVYILIGGILINLLLLTLFLSLSRASRRTLIFADRMTDEFKQKAKALEKSNAELESFAYVASHDLKTPLRGIADLTTYLDEDLEAYLSKSDANPEVRHNLERLHQQTHRMESLISGILDYSGVGARCETAEFVNVGVLLQSMRNSMNLAADQLILEDSYPILATYRTRFDQVIGNLVENAFKYHHDRENAKVQVTCEESQDFYVFSVTDNGPGIDPKFHSRIFEIFQTLQSKDEIESSGVGLSIVKKSVENLGGSISVSSEPGKGTTFQFEWPKSIDIKSRKPVAVS